MTRDDLIEVEKAYVRLKAGLPLALGMPSKEETEGVIQISGKYFVGDWIETANTYLYLLGYKEEIFAIKELAANPDLQFVLKLVREGEESEMSNESLS